MEEYTTFWGYQREDGQVGVRNLLAVIATVHCANFVAERIAAAVGGVSVTHELGCMQIGADLEQTKRVLRGVGNNPNVGAALVVGLGCEQVYARVLANSITGKPVEYLNIQEKGGTIKAIAAGIQQAQPLLQFLSQQRVMECPTSKLVLGVKCGGSDPTSGLAANPALGIASDMLIERGGTVITGTESMYGCEHILAKRAIAKEVGQQILASYQKLEQDAALMGHSFKEANPTPGNKRAGITTMVEKGLGAMMKSGSSPIMGYLEAGARPRGPGLWIMEARGADLPHLAIAAAGGAQIIVFTTGQGNPIGLPIAPVIKVTGNGNTYRTQQDDFDLDLSPVIEQGETIEHAGRRMFAEIMAVANGRICKAEILGHREFAIPKIGSSI
jgi:altronate dehydratase large subunit